MPAQAESDAGHRVTGPKETAGLASDHKTTEDINSKPIPGPSSVGPEYALEADYKQPLSPALAIGRFLADTVRVPAVWIRKNVVEPNRGPKYYYYHRKWPRAVPIDECYLDDQACIYEANLEYHRIRKVDRATLDILRYRRDNCYFWYSSQHQDNHLDSACDEILETFQREETNYHIKYGDLHHHWGVMQAYNKQKHRMIVDRRRAQKAQEAEANAGKE